MCNGLDVVLIAIALAAIILDIRSLFSDSILNVGDARAHIHRISFLSSSLGFEGLPSWDSSWYTGYPFFYSYPPLTYIFGAFLTSIFKNPVFVYKLLSIFALSLQGVAIYLFARKVLKASGFTSLLSMIVYMTSAPLFYTYYPWGAIPCNLAWGFSILFFVSYFRRIETGKRVFFVLSALLLSAVVLTHIFAAVATVIAVLVFHLSHRERHFGRKIMMGISSMIIGLLIAGFWLFPFFLSVGQMTPLCEFVPSAFEVSIPFLIFVVIAIILMIFYKHGFGYFWGDTKWRWCFLMIVLFVILGFGGIGYLPFGEFLLGWRFLTIFMPFFAILCVLVMAEKNLPIKSTLAVVLSLILAQTLAAAAVGGAIPELRSDYKTQQYREIVDAIDNRYRVIVPYGDSLWTSDSMITFANEFHISTVTAAYSQGDPHFFDYTVHVEWERNWLRHPVSRQNLMQESDARYLFVKQEDVGYYENTEGINSVVSNGYGTLFRLDNEPFFAATVNPIILDVEAPDKFTNFFNLLVPDGYKMVFVTSELGSSLQTSYVMVDDVEKVENWVKSGKNVVFLHENNNVGSRIENNVFHIYGPFSSYSNEFFYYDRGNVSGYRTVDQKNEEDAKPNENQWQQIQQISELLQQFINLTYENVAYSRGNDWIKISRADPGFVLVKETFHSNWAPDAGEIYKTTQGFILIYLDQARDNLTISYSQSRSESIAPIASLIGLLLLAMCAIFWDKVSSHLRQPRT